MHGKQKEWGRLIYNPPSQDILNFEIEDDFYKQIKLIQFRETNKKVAKWQSGVFF